MSDQEEVIRLKFEANTAAVDASKTKSAALKQELASLKSELAAGTITQTQYTAGWVKLMGQFKENAREAKQLQTSMGSVSQSVGAVSQSAAKGGEKVKDFGRAAYVASQGLEDLQYGLGGVINNIPQLVMAFGGGAGLTAAISLTAVAINQLVKHWAEINQMFDPQAVKGFASGLNTFKEKLQELESKTIKIPVELDVADDLKRLIERSEGAKKQVEESLHKPTEGEAKAKTEVERILNADPNSEADITRKLIDAEVAKKIEGPYRAQIEKLQAEAKSKQEFADTSKAINPGSVGYNQALQEGADKAQDAVTNLFSEIRRRAREDPGGVGDTIKEAKTGHAGSIKELASRAEQAGMGVLARQLDRATADKIKDIEKENVMWENLHRETLAARRKEEEQRKTETEGDIAQRKLFNETQKILDDQELDAEKGLLNAKIHALEKLKQEKEKYDAKELEQIKHFATQFDDVFNVRILQRMFMGAARGKASEALDEAIAKRIAFDIGHSVLARRIAPDQRMGVARQMVAAQRDQFDMQRLGANLNMGFDPFTGPQQQRRARRPMTNRERAQQTQLDRQRAAAGAEARKAAAERKRAQAAFRQAKPGARQMMGPQRGMQEAIRPGPKDPEQVMQDAIKSTDTNTTEVGKLNKKIDDLITAIKDPKKLVL